MISLDATVAPATRLFDLHGRRAAANLTAAAHRAVRRRFICNQPTIDYVAIHGRISRHLDCPDAISVAEFQTRAEAILDKLRANERCADIVNAVAVPFFLPHTPEAACSDPGVDLEETYLPAVDRAFREMFPNRVFVNQYKHGLAGKLSVAARSRHDRLLRSMQNSAVVGIVFVSLTEFSIPAAMEQLVELPPNVFLTGGADLSAAFIGCPDLLLRTDGYPPLIWMAGLAADSPTAAFHFEAYGYDLNFNRRVHLDMAAEYWACALTVLG